MGFNDPDKIFKAALEKWGKEAQLNQLQEECGELVAAVNQYRRGRVSDVEVVSEIADVMILVFQMEHVFGASLLQSQMEIKMSKLKERLGV